jgi:ABC-2 type transport system permease protein
MMAMSSLGLIVFLGFGLIIAGRTNNENSASPLANLVTLPQFLLSGVFFPTDAFPSWVRIVADLLPLSFFNAAMRRIAAEGAGFGDLLPSIVGLCAWGVAAYFVASRSFKWV